MHTLMGYICQGRPLHEKHPFFVARRVDAEEVVAPSVGGRRTGSNVNEAETGYMDIEDEWGSDGSVGAG